MSDTEKLAEAINRLATALDLLANKLSYLPGGYTYFEPKPKVDTLDSPYVYGDINNGNR